VQPVTSLLLGQKVKFSLTCIFNWENYDNLFRDACLEFQNMNSTNESYKHLNHRFEAGLWSFISRAGLHAVMYL